jgi:aspartyl-tRNA(Asn)/glutamyl-tRNA(Gln) amidotransferase subunit A
VRRLQAAGAVLLGKTNMMEFAYGYPHPDFGETRNPWDLTRTAGGSSGGSAAAVTAGLAYAALGSDTGGSIRSPAAYCGIVGLKPTYGRVSRAGVVPLAWSLDHAGPLTRSARDCALVFDAIAGYDPLDPASASAPFTPTVDALDGSVAGLRVGVVEELFARHVTPDVRALTEAALRELEQLGVVLERVELPHAREVGPVIMPIIQAEATSFHWPRLMTRPVDYSTALRENLLLGATVLAKDYLDAQRARRLMQDEVNAVLTRVDALVFPTQPIVAPLLDAYAVGDGVEEDVLDVEIGHTGLANLTGHPALSVPCGFTADGLPVGLQLTGRWFDEATVLRLARAYEEATPWSTRRPTFVS